MPFGYNMNKVHATKKEDFIEKKSNSDKQKTNKYIITGWWSWVNWSK